MASVLVWNAALRLFPIVGPVLYRNIHYLQGPTYPGKLRLTEELKRRLADPQEDDETLSRELSRVNGYPVTVATYTGPFETRRVQLEWSLSGPNVLNEDVRVCTFHFVKLAGGLPSPDWVVQDFADVEVAFTAWWTALRPYYNTGLSWSNIAFYKEGPDLIPPQPPVYQNAQTLAGSSAVASLPPQIALSVTEMAGSKKNWGRFYLPAPCVTDQAAVPTVTNAGRPSTPFITAVADATRTLYNTCMQKSKPVVVYRAKLEAGRPHSGASPLPERPANAQTVDQIQIDDVWDVIRSRRYETPMLRVQRAITGTTFAEEELPQTEPTYPEPENDQPLSDL